MVTKTIMLLKGASIDGVVINDAATTTTVHSDVDLSVVTPINRTFGALSDIRPRNLSRKAVLVDFR